MALGWRIFLGLLGAWTLLKTPFIFIVARRTRAQLSEAEDHVRRTLRNRVIGAYANVLVNVVIAAIVLDVALFARSAFFKDYRAVLLGTLGIAFLGMLLGLKSAFYSLHEPAIEDFDKRFRIKPFRWTATAKQRSDDYPPRSQP